MEQDVFIGLSSIDFIELNGNQIISIAENIFMPSSIYCVDLVGNGLSEIPNFGLKRMAELHMSYNRIVNLQFINILSLQTLSVSSNLISDIQNTAFSNVRDLLVLELQNNKVMDTT